MNKKTVALNQQQYERIIKTILTGFICSDGHIVKGNQRIATALVLEANLGIRISDILKLSLNSIIHDGNRYRLDSPAARLFPISERAVQKSLKLACDYLGYENISTHSFRKYFGTNIYEENNHDINLVRVLLQHSSVTTTQRYIGIAQDQIETALQKHIKLL